MADFDEYWDTRIDENRTFFQSGPQVANWAYKEARLAYETGQEKGDSFKLAESERHRQILTQQCMEKNARIAELERQLAESESNSAEMCAGYCDWIGKGGKYGDDHGHACCHAIAQLAELREAVRTEHAAYANAESCSCPDCMRDFDDAYRRIDALLEGK